MSDEPRKKLLSDLFDEALVISSEESLTQSTLFKELQACSDRYADMKVYKTGGSKIIHEAHDKMTDRRVAIATLKENPDSVQIDSFIREARLNALLQHPNIIPVYDMGVNGNQPFFSMKFIAGTTLADIIDGLNNKDEEYQRKYPLTVLVDIFLNICNGMSYAHSQGIMHLDLKPENIRVDKFGDVLICDWGLSAIIDDHETINDYFGSLENYSINQIDLQNPTMDGYIKGTPGYMAPEQTGRTKFSKGTWTDTFSLGCILYSLLSFRAPFRGDLETILMNTAKSKCPKPSDIVPEIPTQLEAICIKAMSLDPDDRYKKVEELHADILAYRNGYITSAEDFTLFKFLVFFVKRNKAVSAVAFISFSLLLIFTLYFISSLDESRDDALKLAEKYRYEKNENVKRGAILSTQFIEKYDEAYKIHDYEDALSYAESAIRLDPSRRIAYLYKGHMHCINYRFKEALEAYEQAGQDDFLYDLSKKYVNSPQPLSIETKLQIVEECVKAKGNSRPASDFIHNQVYSEMEINNRLEFVKGILKLYNPQIESLHFYYDKESEYLDVSNNPNLSWGFSLQNFPLKSLNISYTKLNTLRAMKAVVVQELNASHTRISNLFELTVENLRSLDISHTQVEHLKLLENSPIQTLNISYTNVKSLSSLRRMKYLRNLIVHKGQFSQSELAKVPKKVEVMIVDF
ncbi:MAG: protein kinase [Lentisphaeraceae bacterium]|nr:protein kinase [Lentisphaeraceae bacterium]